MRELRPGRMIARRYRLERQLGRGGMGSVWLAFDTLSDETIALKLLSEPLSEDPGVRGRLLRELKAGRRVTHPNVCRVHDLGRHGGRLFVTMEYVEGQDLAHLLVAQQGKLTLGRRFDLAFQIVEGLKAIHNVGLVHRDLKPSNVLVDTQGLVRVTDFGLAREFAGGPQPADPATGPFIGTPGYMSPEQILGRRLDERSDVYSFGVLLFELFTGRPLFEGTYAELLVSSLTKAPSLTARSWWDLPTTVAVVLRRCLRKDRKARLGSASLVLQELRAARERVTAELRRAGVDDLSEQDRFSRDVRAFRLPRCPGVEWTRGGRRIGPWRIYPRGTPVSLTLSMKRMEEEGITERNLALLARAVGGLEPQSLFSLELEQGRAGAALAVHGGAAATLAKRALVLTTESVDLSGVADEALARSLLSETPASVCRIGLDGRCVGGALLSDVAKRHNLRSLTLWGSPRPEVWLLDGWGALAAHSELRRVTLVLSSGEVPPTSWLRSWAGIHSLGIHNFTTIDRKQVDAICSLPHLRKLVLHSSPAAGPVALDTLVDAQGLEELIWLELELSNGSWLTRPLADQLFRRLVAMRRLQVALEPEAMQALEQLRSVESLDVTVHGSDAWSLAEAQAKAAVTLIRSMPSLRRFVVRYSEIDEDSTALDRRRFRALFEALDLSAFQELKFAQAWLVDGQQVTIHNPRAFAPEIVLDYEGALRRAWQSAREQYIRPFTDSECEAWLTTGKEGAEQVTARVDLVTDSSPPDFNPCEQIFKALGWYRAGSAGDLEMLVRERLQSSPRPWSSVRGVPRLGLWRQEL